MENVLSVKSDMNDGIIKLFGRFSLVDQFWHLSLLKQSDVSVVMLILSLSLFRTNGMSIFCACW